MNETCKKFTAEIRAKIAEAFASPDIRSIVEATKSAADNGTFEVVISTDNIDRQGETIKQDGWDLSFYKLNPVVLWGHDYYSLPIGICDEITVSGGKLTAKGRFAPEEANPFAQQVRRLYDLKIVRATSVGFIALDMEGNVISKAELLEFSFVPVPANPYALSLAQAKEFNLDFAMLATKGLKLDIHVAAEGDACDMPDGSMGEMHPNDAGEMVCMPKKSAAAMGDECTMGDGTMGTMQDDGNGGMVCKPKSAEAEKSPACRQEGETEEDCRARKISEMEGEGMDHDQAVAAAIDICKTACSEKQFCAICAKEYPKGSRCNQNFFTIGRNHPEDTGYDGSKFYMFQPDKKDAQQIGAILAQLQNVIDEALVIASRLILDIIQSEYAQSVAGKAEIAELAKSNTIFTAIKTQIADLEQKLDIGEGEESRNGGTPKQRPEGGQAIVPLSDLNDFLMVRELVASVNRATNESLSRINKKISEKRGDRRPK